MPRRTSKLFTPTFPLPKTMVEAALWNVNYHRFKIDELLAGRGMTTLWHDDPSLDDKAKFHLQGEVSRFHAHLRAFFWELVAAFESMRIWAKEYGAASKQVQEIKAAANSDWYAEISEYRNFAHRSFLVAQGIFGTQDRQSKFLYLIAPKDPPRELKEHLDYYQKHMRDLFDTLK